MSNVKIVLNSDGIKKMLQSSEMLSLTEQIASEQADGNSELKSFIGFDRAKTLIIPNSEANSNDN